MQFWMLCLFETILLFFEIPWERFLFYTHPTSRLTMTFVLMIRR